MGNAAETKHREWMLVQRLNAELGAVSVHRARYLTAHYGLWAAPITDADLRFALIADNPDLRDTAVRWYNRVRASGHVMSRAQILALRSPAPTPAWA